MVLAKDTELHPPPYEFPFFLISDSALAIAVGDVVRTILIIMGFMLCGSAVWLMRMAWSLPKHGGALLHFRNWALICFVVSTTGTEYIRLHDPVSSRLPINVLAFVLAALAFRFSSEELLEKTRKRRDAVRRLEEE